MVPNKKFLGSGLHFKQFGGIIFSTVMYAEKQSRFLVIDIGRHTSCSSESPESHWVFHAHCVVAVVEVNHDRTHLAIERKINLYFFTKKCLNVWCFYIYLLYK